MASCTNHSPWQKMTQKHASNYDNRFIVIWWCPLCGRVIIQVDLNTVYDSQTYGH